MPTPRSIRIGLWSLVAVICAVGFVRAFGEYALLALVAGLVLGAVWGQQEGEERGQMRMLKELNHWGCLDLARGDMPESERARFEYMLRTGNGPFGSPPRGYSAGGRGEGA